MRTRVKVRGHLTLREAMGNIDESELEIDHPTITGVLVELSNRYGDNFRRFVFDSYGKEIRPNVHILINGRHYRKLQEKLNTELTDGDILDIYPLSAGG